MRRLSAAAASPITGCGSAAARRRPARASARHRPRASSIQPAPSQSSFCARCPRVDRLLPLPKFHQVPDAPVFLPCLPPLSSPRPTDRSAGRPGGAPGCAAKYDHTRSAANRAVRRASRCGQSGSPTRKQIARRMRTIHGPGTGAAMCASEPRPTPRYTKRRGRNLGTHARRAGARARNSCGAQADAQMRNKARAHGGRARVVGPGAWCVIHQRRELTERTKPHAPHPRRGGTRAARAPRASHRAHCTADACSRSGASHHIITSHHILTPRRTIMQPPSHPPELSPIQMHKDGHGDGDGSWINTTQDASLCRSCVAACETPPRTAAGIK